MRVAAALTCLLLAACAPAEAPDAGTPDAGAPDAGTSDAGIDPASSGLLERPPNPDCVSLDEPPALLSQHPCFTGSPPTAGPALVPYTVLAPLWSDGAEKQRYLALPDGTAFEVQPDGDWHLPPGGVLVKEFARDGQLLETRLFTRSESGERRAFTYVWREDGSDADLESDGAIVVTDEGEWHVPTQAECFKCHTRAAGYSLGLETQQLATELTYPSTGRTADQLTTLAFLGMLPRQRNPQPLPAYDDEAHSLTARARSYLHANCAGCHSPAGPGEGNLDLRFQTSRPSMGVCDEPPETGDPTPGGDGVIVAPGEPERSILLERMLSLDESWRMPPLGSAQVDPVGTALVRAFIEELEGCP